MMPHDLYQLVAPSNKAVRLADSFLKRKELIVDLSPYTSRHHSANALAIFLQAVEGKAEADRLLNEQFEADFYRLLRCMTLDDLFSLVAIYLLWLDDRDCASRGYIRWAA